MAGMVHSGHRTITGKPDPSKSVFINCPFDSEFEKLFDSIIFATVCCGFLPRSALETGNVGNPRMDRIIGAIFSSKYSIHDLSRCRGEGELSLARFNMPLELGIAMSLRFLCKSIDQNSRFPESHEWLVLVPRGHLYNRFISDLSGYDPLEHDEDVNTVVRNVMSWLVTKPEAVAPYPRPSKVVTAFEAFYADKMSLSDEWGENIPWFELIQAAHDNIPTP